MESRILAPLNTLETQITSLIQTLSTTNTWASAPIQTQALLSTDDDLSTAITLLQRHQQNYARILHLREESLALEEGLKSTIRQCISLREEVGRIHPSILDDDDDDSDDDDNNEEKGQYNGTNSSVDYHTLLSFAARVGKHNASAAREAESESTRLKLAAKSTSPSTGTGTANGVLETQTRTEETDAELQRINNNIAFRHAQMGMAFPDASSLRVGELGKLQLFRERQAVLVSAVDVQRQQEEIDNLVDKEVERWVRESEDVADATDDAPGGDGDGDGDVAVDEAMGGGGTGEASSSRDLTSAARRRASHGPGTQSRPQLGQAPAAPKRKLDLDFPSSDDEDDD
ncbi:hypothetical protein PV10_02659 [Exophiala mesophila]|uniref:Mediator of RNA polymerase II transcription subunit 4 n=1 Tax=Exophiala mesophila TaxID=212818 RepID=A0A0D1WZJ8_EXOME|nr:uncharacterized protein PV10_02659 [Exophiala mesophila]KIV94945.1 hypothetical protein PV10_02659 [Exophiala mesophila]